MATGDAPLTRRFDDDPSSGLWRPRSTRPPILPTERRFIWGAEVAVGLDFGALLLSGVRLFTVDRVCAPRLSELVALELDFVFVGVGFGVLMLLGVLFLAVELGCAPRLSVPVALEPDFGLVGVGFGVLLLLGVLFLAVELGCAPRLPALAVELDFTDGFELNTLGGGPDGDLEEEEEDP